MFNFLILKIYFYYINLYIQIKIFINGVYKPSVKFRNILNYKLFIISFKLTKSVFSTLFNVNSISGTLY